MVKDQDDIRVQCTPDSKFDVDFCRSTLEKDGTHFTDEQITIIRDFLWEMAQLSVESFKQQQYGAEEKNIFESEW